MVISQTERPVLLLYFRLDDAAAACVNAVVATRGLQAELTSPLLCDLIYSCWLRSASMLHSLLGFVPAATANAF